MKITTWANRKWDWAIYRLAYGAMRRMAKTDPAFVRIIFLQIQDMMRRNTLFKSHEEAADFFFESLRDHKNRQFSGESNKGIYCCPPHGGHGFLSDCVERNKGASDRSRGIAPNQ